MLVKQISNWESLTRGLWFEFLARLVLNLKIRNDKNIA